MPNGKPGDHPYTDIVLHRTDVYGREIDELVREIDRTGPEVLKTQVSDLLPMPWPAERVDRVALLSEIKRLQKEADTTQ